MSTQQLLSKSQHQQLLVHYGEIMQELTWSLSNKETRGRFREDNLRMYQRAGFSDLVESARDQVYANNRQKKLMIYAIGLLNKDIQTLING